MKGGVARDRVSVCYETTAEVAVFGHTARWASSILCVERWIEHAFSI